MAFGIVGYLEVQDTATCFEALKRGVMNGGSGVSIFSGSGSLGYKNLGVPENIAISIKIEWDLIPTDPLFGPVNC